MPYHIGAVTQGRIQPKTEEGGAVDQSGRPPNMRVPIISQQI